jgi:ABC-type transport system involved in multi-copper enzyme maturation permease subunit
MTRLVSVELRRLLSRRLVRTIGMLAILGMLIAGITLFVKSHRIGPGGERILRAQAQAEHAKQVAACSRGEFGIPPQAIPPGQTLDQFCAETVVPEQLPDPRFHLTHVKDLVGTNPPLIILLLVIGASFIGAEWHAGTVATLLVWEPRRLRVFIAKALALALFAFVAAVVVQALLVAALAPAAVFRGTTTGVDATWVRQLLGLGFRGALVGTVVALIGFAIASLGRNTAAALGAVFAYLVVLEPLLRSLRPKWQPWLLYDNIVTFIQGHASDFTQHPRSLLGAGVMIGLYTVGLGTIAAMAFHRRDVT